MTQSATVGDLYLPQVWRRQNVVKVDTWGGKGVHTKTGEIPEDISNLTGTLTLEYTTVQDAEAAESLLGSWSANDDLVHVEASSTGRISLTNQRTGQRVVVGP